MTIRRSRLAIAGVAVLMTVGVLVWSAAPPSGIGRLSCIRVRTGMSQAQVEAVLGCPPGDYRAEPHAICESWLHHLGETRQDWSSDDGQLRIVFAQRRVVRAEWQPRHATAADRLLQWCALHVAMP